MTNNFEFIKQYMIELGIPMLQKNVGDLFFQVLLIRRGKDHPNLPSANYTFKSYYIDSIEKLNIVQDEIIKCCDIFKLRAYVSVAVKSKESYTKLCASNFSFNIYNNEFKKPWRVIDHVFGKLKSIEDRWIIDIDDNPSIEYFNEILRLISICDSKFEDPYITHINTKSGIHVIAHPFNLKQFNDLCEYNQIEKPDIKKDHITLLYENL